MQKEGLWTRLARISECGLLCIIYNIIIICVCACDNNIIIIMALFLSIWCHLIYGLVPARLYQHNFLQRYVSFLLKVEPCQLAVHLTASHAPHVLAWEEHCQFSDEKCNKKCAWLFVLRAWIPCLLVTNDNICIVVLTETPGMYIHCLQHLLYSVYRTKCFKHFSILWLTSIWIEWQMREERDDNVGALVFAVRDCNSV